MITDVAAVATMVAAVVGIADIFAVQTEHERATCASVRGPRLGTRAVDTCHGLKSTRGGQMDGATGGCRSWTDTSLDGYD